MGPRLRDLSYLCKRLKLENILLSYTVHRTVLIVCTLFIKTFETIACVFNEATNPCCKTDSNKFSVRVCQGPGDTLTKYKYVV